MKVLFVQHFPQHVQAAPIHSGTGLVSMLIVISA